MSDPLDWKSLLRRAHARKIYHGSMSFYLALLGEVREAWPPEGTVLEYGAVGSEFLRLVHLAFEYGEAIGLLLGADDPVGAKCWPPPTGPRCRFASAANGPVAPASVDVAFSQEVLGLLPDLTAHARDMFDWLRGGAYYYAAFGWHAAAPRYPSRAKRLQEREVALHAHTLDGAAAALHAAGFEVAVKRLPVTCGVVYDPNTAVANGNLAALLEDVHEHKYLFTCLKPEEKRP
jgi:hypothetical protein